MSLRQIIPPAAEPLTLEETKLHCRVEHSLDDGLILGLIGAARRAAEHKTGRAFIRQTWERVLDAFPPVEIQLAKAPVLSVLQLTYIDPAGATQTLPASSYVLDEVRMPGWVLPAAGSSWPATSAAVGSVRVMFRCGMGDTAADIQAQAPEARQWMLLQVAAMYENRAALAQGRPVQELPARFVDGLLDGLRVYA